MHEGRTVFAQLMDWLPRHELAKCVARYRGDFHARSNDPPATLAHRPH